MKHLRTVLLATLTTSIFMTGCTTSIPPAQPNLPNPPVKADAHDVKAQAMLVFDALRQGNYHAITPHIHPTKGVRFSMYAYVDSKKDKVFNQADFAKYLQQSKIKFTWGELDGTGEPLITPLPTYLTTWVQANNFPPQSMTVNRFVASGNSLNNLQEVYPNHPFVEFYKAGSEQYAEMDWQALRLVFEEYQGRLYLVAIINDQWTT